MFFSSVSYPVDAAEFMTAGEMRNERYTMIQISGHLGGLLLSPLFVSFLPLQIQCILRLYLQMADRHCSLAFEHSAAFSS